MTAVLTAAVLWCLLCGRLPGPVLLLLCLAAGGLLGVLSRHEHGGALTVDHIAVGSRLWGINPALKAAACTAMLVLCLLTGRPRSGLAILCLTALFTVWAGGVPLHDYLRLFSPPAFFLLLSALALLFRFSPEAGGVISLPFPGGFLTVSRETQAQTALVIARALAAVSCLYLLALTTPMPELIGVLRGLRVPAVVTELMVLIYRYIFLLLDSSRRMRESAASRLGYDGWRRSVSTTGKVYGMLLLQSLRRAERCFDAMESRCCEGEIRFLETKKPPTLRDVSAAVLMVLAASLPAVCGG